MIIAAVRVMAFYSVAGVSSGTVAADEQGGYRHALVHSVVDGGALHARVTRLDRTPVRLGLGLGFWWYWEAFEAGDVPA